MKDDIVVYWAPDFVEDKIDWNILYNTPTNVWTNLKEKINKKSTDSQLLVCPAVKDILKNTFYFSSTSPVDYLYDEVSKSFISRIKNYTGISYVRSPSLENRLHLTLGLSWIFFCEEPLQIEITPPYFSDAEHLRYGSVVPGTFDISNWFRPFNAEFVLKYKNKELVVKENEPIMFVKFKTEKNIILKRFVMNEQLRKIEQSCSKSGSIFGRNMNLESRYAIFRNTKTNKKVANLIKSNLID